MNSSVADKILEKSYKENLDQKGAIKIAVEAFRKALGKEFSFDRLETSVITVKGTKEIKTADLKK